MLKRLLNTMIFLQFPALALCFLQATAQETVYPKTKKTDVSDTYHGQTIADPYRWLEDENSPETAEWIKQQNEVTFSFLEKIPFRDAIRKRLTELWNYEKFTAPVKRGKYYFYFKNNGLQNQSVLYFQRSLDGPPNVFIDPNSFSPDGTVSMGSFSVSNDSRLAAYSISRAGSDWSEIITRGVEIEKLFLDTLKWVKFSGIAWHKDGFYYSRYDAPSDGKTYSKKNEFHKVYYHRTGTKQENDELVYEDKTNPLRIFTARVTEDERFLLIFSSQSSSGGSAVFVKDLANPSSGFITLVSGSSSQFTLVDNTENELLMLTNYGAPKYRLVSIDLKNPAPKNWKTILPEKEELLTGVYPVGDRFAVRYLKDVCSRLYIYTRDGKKEKEIALPGLGMVDHFNGKKGELIAFYSYTTFTSPPVIYKFNLENFTSEVLFKPELPFRSSEYETKQVFYKSKDGTRIPMFLTYKKGIVLDGNNPAFLYGYGGFNISYSPEFRTDRAVFLEKGGIYAVANLRGGGEYGEAWHRAGTKCNKQNVFDDFIAAAEYLVKEKYTSHSKLAIHGRSNGGLLIGAVMTQRPDLSKVALPAVGVLDMLRYHKFTIGWAWAADYGSSDNKNEFDCLLKYSPLHNVKETAYPATLVTTADHDDRVVPAHSYKFISTLQEKQKGNEPVLIRIDTKAGHGSGRPTSKLIEEHADLWAFVFYHLKINFNQ